MITRQTSKFNNWRKIKFNTNRKFVNINKSQFIKKRPLMDKTN